MSLEQVLWQPMGESLPVVSIAHDLASSFTVGAAQTLTIRVTGRLPEGRLLLVAASSPHSHYWYIPAEKAPDGSICASLETFDRVCAACPDVDWTLSLGKKSAGGVVLYPLTKGGKASYVKKLDANFCDDRRRYEAPAANFHQDGTAFSVLPCYTAKNYRLSLLVTERPARFARQISCRIVEVLEESEALHFTIQCPKTLELPLGLYFHGKNAANPILFEAHPVEDFSQSHRFCVSVPKSSVDGITGEAALVCAVEQEDDTLLWCPVRFAEPQSATAFQSRWEFRPVHPERYFFVDEEHILRLTDSDRLSGVTALSQGGEGWRWQLFFPNLNLSQADEVNIIMEKDGSVTRIVCPAEAVAQEHGSLVTADLSALPDTLENTLYSDWLVTLSFCHGQDKRILPVLDPLHTYYDAHDFQTAYNFTSDLNRQPIGTAPLFGRTVEGCPHWVRKHNTRMCLRMADHTLRYMTSFTCRAELGKLHFGVLTMKIQCPKLEGDLKGRWTGFVLSHRAKQEADRKDYEFPLTAVKDCGDHYEATVKIKVKKLDFSPLYWDMRVIFEQDGTRFWCSVKAPMVKSGRSERIKGAIRSLFFGESVILNEKYQLFLYRTAFNRFSLVCQERSPYSGLLFRLKERFAFLLYYLFRKQLKKQSILLTYEKYCCMAQDNGFYFFRHCMEHNMEQELNRRIYFVIDKKAKDYQEHLLPYRDHVIQFMSLRHMVYLLGCRLMVSSDSKAHAYAWRCKESIIQPYIEKNRRLVFLQHGVIALKKVDFFRSGTNVVDLFVTSNDREHDIIVEELGYQPHEVIITGLTRWDVMEDRSAQQSPKSILIMPTWRNWLEEVSDETFRQSDYYRNYMALLNDPRLESYLEKYDLQLNFYIHPKFREYIGNFSISGQRVRLIPFGAEPLNQLMMECSMLITDYSSVCWDVYHQGKPVLFYQFDTAKYNETQGAYIDLETELFGDRATRPEELFALMEQYAADGFRLPPKYAAMRPAMYKYLDRNNSQRVIEEIRKRNW